MRLLTIAAAGTGLLAPLLLPLPAFAHAFGQQYTLPLPLSFYVVGASAALIASFVILSFFSNPAPARVSPRKIIVLADSGAARAMFLGLRVFGFAMLALAVATGFLGSDETARNPALFLFWIGLLLVMVYAQSVVAGIWESVDPFRFSVGRIFGKGYRPLSVFPRGLRYVPAVLFYYWLIWFELLSYGAGAFPQNIAFVLLGYLLLAYLGAGIFGADAWLRWGDPFSVLFGTVGKFAPVELSHSEIHIQPPAERLVNDEPDGPGLLLFILLILSATAFDGIRETKPWADFFHAYPVLVEHYAGATMFIWFFSPFLFLGCFAIAVYLMRLITGYAGYVNLVLKFAFSLVPIAVAYSVAHYFALVVSEGQNLIPVLSDPFGNGSNFFGTAGYAYNPALISASAIWYIQVSSIVIGHIVAAYVAHRIALKEFPTRTQVLLGQIPMVALMVLYTGFGLWISSLPYDSVL
jgi:hypothetical protein